MGTNKSRKPDRAYLHVEEVGGIKVFRVGSIRFDLLDGYDAVRLMERASVSVIRQGKSIAEGDVDEYGTHGARHYFSGVAHICKGKQFAPGGSGLITFLRAEYFEVGDVVQISTPGSVIRRHLLENWYSQLRKSPKFKEIVEEYERKRRAYEERYDKKHTARGTKFSKEDAVAHLAYTSRLFTRPLYVLLAKEPIPYVIMWKDRYS